MKKIPRFWKWEVIMVVNLKMNLLKNFVKNMEFSMNSLLLELHMQNGVVERKNRSLQEMARTMMHENNLAKFFWAEAVNTACYIQNRIYIRPILNKTTYELFKGRKPNISYFHQFGCTCWIFTFFFFFSCALLLLITFLSFSIVDSSQWNGSVEWNDKVYGPYIVVSK